MISPKARSGVCSRCRTSNKEKYAVRVLLPRWTELVGGFPEYDEFERPAMVVPMPHSPRRDALSILFKCCILFAVNISMQFSTNHNAPTCKKHYLVMSFGRAATNTDGGSFPICDALISFTHIILILCSGPTYNTNPPTVSQ